MKLINPNDIHFVLAPIAPLLPGEQVHHESVAFQQVVGMIRRIEAEPVKHAHWDEDEYGFYSCSNCGYEWDEAEYKTKYCPECGAKMDEPQESENKE